MAQIKIDGFVHEIPNITLGDSILIRTVTGFALEDLGEAPESIQALAVAAVALRRANPDWSRERILKAVEAIKELEGIPDEADPQAAAASESSPIASDESTITPESSGQAPTA